MSYIYGGLRADYFLGWHRSFLRYDVVMLICYLKRLTILLPLDQSQARCLHLFPNVLKVQILENTHLLSCQDKIRRSMALSFANCYSQQPVTNLD